MKRFFLLSVMLFGVTALVMGKSLSISSVTWVDYQADFNDQFETVGKGNFYIGRQQFNFAGELNEIIEGKVTLDFSSSGLSNDSYFRLAYTRFNLAEPFRVTLGMQKVQFGIHQFWSFPMPVSSHPSIKKVIPSFDLGLAFSGMLADGVFEYDLQFMNGEGFKTWYAQDDVNFAGTANALLNYTEMGTVGLSYLYADVETDFDMAFALFVYHELDFASIMFEFLGELADAELDSYFSTMLTVHALDKLDLLARVDAKMDADTEVYIGANYHPIDELQIKPLVGIYLQEQTEFFLKAESSLKLGWTWTEEEDDEAQEETEAE